MNKQRRKSLSELAEQLRELSGKADDVKSQLETLRDEEQDYFDNMPESLQSGDKGQAAENAVSEMDSAIDHLDQVISEMDDAASSIESSMEG